MNDGRVVAGELGVAVHAERVPAGGERREGRGAPQRAQGRLQALRVIAGEPQHDVRIRAQTRHVVDAAEGDAGGGELIDRDGQR